MGKEREFGSEKKKLEKTKVNRDKKTTSKIIYPIVSGEQLNCNHYLLSSTSYTR